jgi:hypothetical protein
VQVSKESSIAFKKPKPRSLKNFKSKRKMCALEKLPTELLEAVFFYCMNLSLPRASPIIGAKLSSERVYNWTIVNSFGPTWEEYGARTDPLGAENTLGDPKLQVRAHTITR